MAQALKCAEFEALSIRAKIAFAIRTRLEYLAPYRDELRQALLIAAKEVDGAREVRDHFGRVSPWRWGT